MALPWHLWAMSAKPRLTYLWAWGGKGGKEGGSFSRATDSGAVQAGREPQPPVHTDPIVLLLCLLPPWEALSPPIRGRGDKERGVHRPAESAKSVTAILQYP